MSEERKSALLTAFIAIGVIILGFLTMQKGTNSDKLLSYLICAKNVDKENNEYFDLVVIYEDSSSTEIAYDKNTGVMYYIKSNSHAYGITPIYNADGRIKLYEGENDG